MCESLTLRYAHWPTAACTLAQPRSETNAKIGFIAENTISSDSASTGEDISGLSEAQWSLEYEQGASAPWERIMLACVVALWVPVVLAWVHIVFHRARQGGYKVRMDDCVTESYSWKLSRAPPPCILMSSLGFCFFVLGCWYQFVLFVIIDFT